MNKISKFFEERKKRRIDLREMRDIRKKIQERYPFDPIESMREYANLVINNVKQENKNNMKYGVILARFQPVHNGHLALIKKACSENDKVLLLVGSADKFNDRNPIPVKYRIDMLNKALEDCGLFNKCIIMPFNDLTSENDNSIEWGFYLYANVIDRIGQSDFTIYYSDGYDIITTWFPNNILKNFVSLSLLARNKVENGISATQVRESIIKDDNALEAMVPKSVFENRDTLKAFIEISQKNK